MSTHTSRASVARTLVAVAALTASVACGSEMLRTGRSPVYLIVMAIDAGASNGAILRSDVQALVDAPSGGSTTAKVATVFDDVAVATIRVEQKNTTETGTSSSLNTVTINRYHVEYRRADGRNTPGVDVPYGFDGGTSASIGPGSEGDVSFQIVRHQGKLEPPLKNLASLGGQGVISTIAEVTFYGRDQNGNEVAVTARMDVVFSDFPDES
jgi:hypothetical protein